MQSATVDIMCSNVKKKIQKAILLLKDFLNNQIVNFPCSLGNSGLTESLLPLHLKKVLTRISTEEYLHFVPSTYPLRCQH